MDERYKLYVNDLHYNFKNKGKGQALFLAHARWKINTYLELEFQIWLPWDELTWCFYLIYWLVDLLWHPSFCLYTIKAYTIFYLHNHSTCTLHLHYIIHNYASHKMHIYIHTTAFSKSIVFIIQNLKEMKQWKLPDKTWTYTFYYKIFSRGFEIL